MKQGISLDKIDDNAIKKLGYQDRNALGSCMRSSLSKEAMDKYRNETEDKKCEWLKQFLLDP